MEVRNVELALVWIAIILGGTLVSDDILNGKLKLGEKLANRFSRSSAQLTSNLDSDRQGKKTKMLTR